MQKNKKQNAAVRRIFYLISTTGAQDIIQTDSGSYSAGLQLYFGNWSCDLPPNLSLTSVIIIVMFFFTF
jgi:hypothetical protein